MQKLVSLVIASRNHAPLLQRTLQSIFNQKVPFPLEVIVTDDGSTDDTVEVIKQFPVIYRRLENTEYRNGVFAKNRSLVAARGDIIIQQSDDVVHAQPDLIQRLVEELQKGEYLVCTVYDWDWMRGTIGKQYSGVDNRRPLLFLGATWREDVCKVGGYDPDFGHVLWYDDDWFANGLTLGLGLKPRFLPLLGLHQDHFRPDYDWTPAQLIFEEKTEKAKRGESSWLSSAGPWSYQQGVPVEVLFHDPKN